MENEVIFFTTCPLDKKYLQQLSLLNYSLHLKGYRTPIILVPKYSELKKILSKDNFTIKKVDIGFKMKDVYREKFVLKYINSIERNEFFLYLDPDHIVIDDINLHSLADNTIWVSSEVKEYSEVLNDKELELVKASFYSISASDPCFNTSLIYSNTFYFKKILPYWEYVYNSLYNHVSHRHLEEIAFSIAAKQYNFNVSAVEDKIQGNFFVSNNIPSFFHYGGESSNANFMKSEVVNLDIPIDSKYQKILLFLWNYWNT